jgi:eukaryotic-like serine/threonine-protein kinase
MLTGRQAFAGDDVAEILARVLEREPDWSFLPSGVPPRIRELLRLCLEKNAKNRRSDAGDGSTSIGR